MNGREAPTTDARIRAMLARTRKDAPLGLIVEEDDEGADVVGSVLRLLGFQVLRVRKGADALHAVAHSPVALVIYDADMQDLSVSGFIELATKLPNYSGSRLVITSGLHKEDSPLVQTLLKKGASLFFERPYPVSRMRHKLREMFPRNEVTAKEKLTVRDAEALALPAAVMMAGIKRPVRIVAANAERFLIKGQALPLGSMVEVQLKHKQEHFGEMLTIDLVALGRVVSSTVVGGNPLCEIDVELSRPPLEWDRMTDELPDL